MHGLTRHRTNVGIVSDPESMLAQGDFPMRVRSIITRPTYMDVTLNAEGSTAEGTAFEQDIYELPPVVGEDETNPYDL